MIWAWLVGSLAIEAVIAYTGSSWFTWRSGRRRYIRYQGIDVGPWRWRYLWERIEHR